MLYGIKYRTVTGFRQINTIKTKKVDFFILFIFVYNKNTIIKFTVNKNTFFRQIIKYNFRH